MRKRKPTKIEKIKAKAWTRYYALQQEHHLAVKELSNEKSRAERLKYEVDSYAKAIADKNEHIGRLNTDILRKDTNIATLTAERDRVLKITGDFTQFLNSIRNVQTAR